MTEAPLNRKSPVVTNATLAQHGTCYQCDGPTRGAVLEMTTHGVKRKDIAAICEICDLAMTSHGVYPYSKLVGGKRPR